MSDNVDTAYNALANLKSEVWKTFGYYKKKGHLGLQLSIAVAPQISPHIY